MERSEFFCTSCQRARKAIEKSDQRRGGAGNAMCVYCVKRRADALNARKGAR